VGGRERGGLSEEDRRSSGIRREAARRCSRFRKDSGGRENSWGLGSSVLGAIVRITFGTKRSNPLYLFSFQVIHMAHWALFLG
jgi:hypothetical protein